MWIILKIDNQLFKMINTDVCACFQNVNGELGFEHGNYRHTVSTTDIADVQDILDYIAFCLKQKKYICEIPSQEYKYWKSKPYANDRDLEEKLLEVIKKTPVMPILLEGNDYIITYHGVSIEELQKAYEENTLYKKYKEIIDNWAKVGLVNPITPEEIKKIKKQEREEAIKRAIAKAYLLDKKNKNKK